MHHGTWTWQLEVVANKRAHFSLGAPSEAADSPLVHVDDSDAVESPTDRDESDEIDEPGPTDPLDEPEAQRKGSAAMALGVLGLSCRLAGGTCRW